MSHPRCRWKVLKKFIPLKLTIYALIQPCPKNKLNNNASFILLSSSKPHLPLRKIDYQYMLKDLIIYQILPNRTTHLDTLQSIFHLPKVNITLDLNINIAFKIFTLLVSASQPKSLPNLFHSNFQQINKHSSLRPIIHSVKLLPCVAAASYFLLGSQVSLFKALHQTPTNYIVNIIHKTTFQIFCLKLCP